MLHVRYKGKRDAGGVAAEEVGWIWFRVYISECVGLTMETRSNFLSFSRPALRALLLALSPSALSLSLSSLPLCLSFFLARAQSRSSIVTTKPLTDLLLRSLRQCTNPRPRAHRTTDARHKNARLARTHNVHEICEYTHIHTCTDRVWRGMLVSLDKVTGKVRSQGIPRAR